MILATRSMISGGVSLAAWTSACSSSPVRSVTSKPKRFASARNSGSLTVASNARRSAWTRSGGTPGGQQHRAPELDAGREEVERLALLLRLHELVDRGCVEPRHRLFLEREQDAHDAVPDPVGPEVAERLRGGAEPVELATLDRELC